MVKCADLFVVPCRTVGTNPVRIRAIGDHRAPEGGGGTLNRVDIIWEKPRIIEGEKGVIFRGVTLPGLLLGGRQK